MPLILPGNVGSATAGGFNVANSLRYESGSSDYLSRSVSSASNRRTWTYSIWVKRAEVNHGDTQTLLESWSNSSNYFLLYFDDNQDLHVFDFAAGSYTLELITDRKFRDPSAWYHIVIAVDTTDGTASNRVKIYVNGVQETSFSTETYPNQNVETFVNRNRVHSIGNYTGGNHYANFYTSEVVLVDGSQLAPTSFGEFDSDSGIWKPINVSGLTFGTNGFYLQFKESGTSANASGLGADTSGNTHHFTVNNLTAVDQSTDTCTNNFSTMNPLDNYFAGSTFSEGNLKVVTTGGNITYNTSTIGFSSGKWYMETKLAGSAGYTVGVVRGVATANDNGNKLGNRADGWSYDDGGDVEHNGGSLTGSFASYSSGDTIGVYADLDNNELYFSKDGTLQNSGTGLALTAGTYFFAVGDNNSSNSSTYEVNFGGTNTYSVSSGNTDGTYGNFEYSTTITGDGASKTFKALNTKNLAEFGG